MEILRLEQLSFQYPGGNETVLQNINLSIGSGEFIVLCGNSGSGKTTLLRHLKTTAMPHGERRGRILFHGMPLAEADLKEQTGKIGFVSQNPEDQIVTDQVWHELAFGLESLGMDNQTIRKRVAEMSHFFGIQEWFHRETASLSGGQMQLLNLAAVMVMQPEILLLDEPASQLDPIAASEFLGVLSRIHRELGTTILMTEHRLEEVLPVCSRLLVLNQGRLELDGPPREIGEAMRLEQSSMFAAMPAPMRIWNGLGEAGTLCPITVQEGREWFTAYCETHKLVSEREQGGEAGDRPSEKDGGTKTPGKNRECVIALKDIQFRYEKKGRDILRDLSLRAYKGELLAVLGGNGSGKTTLLSVMNQEYRPYQGKVLFPQGQKRVITLPQNPQLLFVESTVRRDLEIMIEEPPGSEGEAPSAGRTLEEVIALCRLEGLLNRHPYDLSGGEQQRLALGKVLLAQPDILLLDEPTKGLDVEYKTIFADILMQLTRQGITAIMVSHDVEFCAEYADRCVLVFDGQIVAEDTPRGFFAENHFYTTNTNRMVRHILPEAVTVGDVIQACKGTGEEAVGGNGAAGQIPGQTPGDGMPSSLNQSMEEADTTDFIPSDTIPSGSSSGRKLPMSSIVGIAMILLAMPLTIFAGIYLLGDEKYLFISLLILLESMLPFFFVYENRKPPARDLVLLSVLCGIGVAGRAIFSALPQLKPVTAITILAGIAYGGETGFLVGALTMLVSNMIFGQGPWTPWQMVAMGLIGLCAGLCFHGRELRHLRLPVCLFGFLSAVLLYGGIMNPASAIISGIAPDWKMLTAYWISGLPFDMIHGATTVLFLAIGAKPILQKLERVKIKFG